MRESNHDDAELPSLHAILVGASQFGLPDDEVWLTVDESVYAVGADATVAEYLDELSGALARRILSAERSAADTEHGVKRVGPGL